MHNFVLDRQAGDYEISHGPSGVSRWVQWESAFIEKNRWKMRMMRININVIVFFNCVLRRWHIFDWVGRPLDGSIPTVILYSDCVAWNPTDASHEDAWKWAMILIDTESVVTCAINIAYGQLDYFHFHFIYWPGAVIKTKIPLAPYEWEEKKDSSVRI